MNSMLKNFSNYQGNSNSNKIQDIFNRIKNLESKGINIINFAFGTPGLDIPERIRIAASEALESNQNQLIPPDGLIELRIKVCDYIDRTRGFRPKLDQILISPSVNTMLFTTLLTCINPGDEVITTNPSVQSYARSAELLGAKVKYVPRFSKNDFKIDFAKMKSLVGKKTKAIILATPHNPTGNLLTNSEVQKISELAEKNNAIIISDETFSQILFKGRHNSPAISDRAQERTVVIESLSYTFNMADWGLGYCLASNKVISAMQSVIRDTQPQVPGIIQYAGCEALKNEDKLLADILKRYKKCAGTLVDGLNELQGFECEMPEGGIFAFPDISRTGQTSLEFANHLLEKAGIAVLPGDVFGKVGKDHIRITYATTIENINEGLTRLEEFF